MTDFSLENGFSGPVCGLDEVGRGPLAGPVVAACVYIPENVRQMDFIHGIKDSKALSETQRRYFAAFIQQHCIFGIAHIQPEDIDRINILQASLQAMTKAFQEIQGTAFAQALVDGNQKPRGIPCPVTTVIKGDSRSKSIAAASILAKVERDRMMSDLARQHPHYGWERNAGYPTKEHMDAIDIHGITPHHRKSFAPIANFIATGETRSQTRVASQITR
jgi:ribonuclease HII